MWHPFMNKLTEDPRRQKTDPAATAPAGHRLTSLDAFRGAIMLLMASSGLGIPQVAQHFPDSPFWTFIGRQCEHATWRGCTLWDLIQPSFMFMVGVALPWSLSNRKAKGQSRVSLFGHALWRSVALVLLAVFLTSAWSKQTEWVFTNVLAQIGLGYPLLFLIALTPARTQWVAAFTILTVAWIAFALHPLPPSGFDWSAVGVPPEWPHLTGFAAHFEKNANVAARFDLWFLNLFPRETPFVFSSGGYQTLNFIPSLATMVFGLIAGRLLRCDLPMVSRVRRLMLFGAIGLLLGGFLDVAGICPIVKRIWSPSWAIFSSGWVALLLGVFVLVIENRAPQPWSFPLVVAGLNPITLYCLWQLSGGFIRENIKRHAGPGVFEILGTLYAPILERFTVLLTFWLILLWMYRRRLFLRL